MNFRALKRALLLLLLFGLIAVYTPAAQAVSISPVTFELSVNPGETIHNVLRVYNDQTVPASVSMNVENFAPAGESGRVVIQDETETTNFSLAQWVKVSPTDFVLEPQSFKAVEFTVSVPANAEPGGHYGSVLATIAPTITSAGAVGIAQKIGALLLLNVSGQVTEKMYVAEFSAPPFSEYGPVNLALRIKNDGTVHLKPRGFIEIKDMFGKEAGKIDLTQYNVLPGMIRRIDIPWEPQYGFGRYTATLSAIYGSGNEVLSAATEFWIVPWKIVGGIVLLILIVLLLLVRGRKRIRMAFKVLAKGDRA